MHLTDPSISLCIAVVESCDDAYVSITSSITINSCTIKIDGIEK